MTKFYNGHGIIQTTLRHGPTGIEVQVGSSPSHHKNEVQAWKYMEAAVIHLEKLQENDNLYYLRDVRKRTPEEEERLLNAIFGRPGPD